MTGEPSANGEDKTKTLDGATPPEVPAYFKEFAARVLERIDAAEGRVGKIKDDVISLRHKVSAKPDGAKPDGDAANGSGKPTGSGSDPDEFRREMRAELKLDGVWDRLPEAAQKRVQAIRENGGSFAQQLELAELALEVAPARDAAGNTPKGATATAAHRPAVAHPDEKDYRRLIVEARKDDAAARRLKALEEDPSFDPLFGKQ